MYNGIGLQTPRGSGTSGHVQSNKFFVKPKTKKVIIDELTWRPSNKDILEHEHKRKTQLKLVILDEKLAALGYTEAEIAEKIAEARWTLEAATEDS